MATKGPLTSAEKLEIVDMLKRGNLSHRELAQRFGRAQSTISAIARDAGITPTHRRKRTPAAKDLEGGFDSPERIKLADSVLGVIGQVIEGGGLNPRELRETTQALKQALDARRAEDPSSAKEEEKSSEIYWEESFAVPGESTGIGFDPRTPVGRQMIEFSRQLDEGRDPFAERWEAERARQQREAQEEGS